MWRRIIEHQVGGAVRCRKSFGCAEPHYIWTVQQLCGATCGHATEFAFDRQAARLANAPFDHTLVFTR